MYEIPFFLVIYHKLNPDWFECHIQMSHISEMQTYSVSRLLCLRSLTQKNKMMVEMIWVMTPGMIQLYNHPGTAIDNSWSSKSCQGAHSGPVPTCSL